VKFGIGMYLWTTDVTEEHLHHFAEMRALGYDGVEIPVSSGNESDWKRVRQALDDAGLECTAMQNVGAEKDPASPDASVRRRAVDEFKWGVDTAHELGSPVLAGPLQSAYGVFTGSGPTDDELDHSADVLREVAEHAAQAGMVLAAEFLNRHESYFMNTLGAGAALAERVGHPAFGILYDTHHAHAEEDDVGAAIREHAAHIHHVQFSENNRGTLGQGQVDWDATVAALADIGYDGWIAAEAFAADVPPLSSAAHVWRNTFDSKDQFARDALPFMRRVTGNG
jgi:D-psicose/D-tagatose/L-ribulose 3-epimerase